MKTKLATLLTVSACLVGYFVMTARSDEREIDALREEAAATLREAKEHSAKGHVDEARELMKRAYAIRAEVEELAAHREQQKAEERRDDEERREHEERERHERREGGHEQIEHIRVAAEHLQAAGMREHAEDLMREAERRQHELQRDREGHHDEGLHRELESLSARVNKLHDRLERMEQYVRKLSERRDD